MSSQEAGRAYVVRYIMKAASESNLKSIEKKKKLVAKTLNKVILLTLLVTQMLLQASPQLINASVTHTKLIS